MSLISPSKKISRKITSLGHNNIKLRYTNCNQYGDAFEENKKNFKKKLSISKKSNEKDLFKDKCLSMGNNCWIEDFPAEDNRQHTKCRKKLYNDTVLLDGEDDETANSDNMISYFCPNNFTSKYENNLYTEFTKQCNDKFNLVKQRYLAFTSSINTNQIPLSIFKYVPSYDGSLVSIKVIEIDEMNIELVKNQLKDISIVMRTIAYNVVKELNMLDACAAMFDALKWIAENIQNFNDDFLIFATGNDDSTYIDTIKTTLSETINMVREMNYPWIWGVSDELNNDLKRELSQTFHDYLYDVSFSKTNNITLFSNVGIVNSDFIIFCVCGIVLNNHSVIDLGDDLNASPLFLYWIKTLTEDSLKRSTTLSTLSDAAKIILIYNIGHELGHLYQGLVGMGLKEFIPIFNATNNCINCSGLYPDSGYIKSNKLRDKELAIQQDDMFGEIVAETYSLLCVEYYLRNTFIHDSTELLNTFQFFFLGLCGSPANIPHLGYSTRIKLLKSNKYLYDLYKQLQKKPSYFRSVGGYIKKSRKRKL